MPDRHDAHTQSDADQFADQSALVVLRRLAAGTLHHVEHMTNAGLRVVEAGLGYVRLSWLPASQLTNPTGVVHGAFIAMALDEAAGLAATSTSDRFVPARTMSLHIEFLRVVRPDAIYEAEGRVLHRGRVRTVAEAVVREPGGGGVAHAVGNFRVM